jgi:uncharacterized damage-inducible protein DinB
MSSSSHQEFAMSAVERLRKQLLNARDLSERMLADFKTPQEWTRQVHPGANHALWFVGHMASTDNFFLSVVRPERAIDLKDLQPHFGMGSQPVDDPNVYPPAETVLAAMRERRAALLDVLGSLTDADLAAKTPDGTPDFLPDLASVFEMAVWHEGLHTGQLGVTRRALGHKPVM